MTPSHIMMNRFYEMQKQQQSSSTSTAPSGDGSKSRTAHVSKPPQEMRGGSLLKRRPSGNAAPDGTRCGSTTKTEKRQAHVPSQQILKRPTIPNGSTGKVPINVRQRYLAIYIDECLKIHSEKKDAYERALAEEKSVNDRSSKKNIYLNLVGCSIKKLRDEAALKQKSPTKGHHNPNAVSHSAILGGTKAMKINYTLNSAGPRKSLDNLTSGQLFDFLTPFILTEEQLTENGFPRPGSGPAGEAILKVPINMKALISKVGERLCSRCSKRFRVDEDGKYLRKDECSYHYGKLWKTRINRSTELQFNCCQGDTSSKGCQVCPYHVHDENKYRNQRGYVQTSARSPSHSSNTEMYAMDCEMIYTEAGLELARVTVINSDLKPCYERLVKPHHPILDYNTRFSGLTAGDFNGVRTAIEHVQKDLCEMFSDKTILIGHSLESDFVALKLIHSTVVDTSVVFPHRQGPPYKRALRTLMAEYMQKIIQNDVGGHNSEEDAASCMELMIWKIKHDAPKR